MRFRNKHLVAMMTVFAIVVLPQTAFAQSEIIDGWTDLLLSASRIVIVFAALLGIAYAGLSLFQAYKADRDEDRTRYLIAALFAGTFTIIGVIIGWISGLLIPAT